MESNFKRIPKSALAFYVDLYCRKRILKPQNNVIEKATKSWLSLSKDERNHFIDKFEERKTQYRKKIADYLKNTKPYLKKKPPRTRIEVSLNSSDKPQENDIRVSTIKTAVEKDKTQENNFYDYEDNNLCQDSFSKTETEFLEQVPKENYLLNNLNTEGQHSVVAETLPEPMPPNVKNGKELFEMIKEIKELDDNTWSTLSMSEKRKYNNAVVALKRDYIKKYEAYLERLPSEELYNHYNMQM